MLKIVVQSDEGSIGTHLTIGDGQLHVKFAVPVREVFVPKEQILDLLRDLQVALTPATE